MKVKCKSCGEVCTPNINKSICPVCGDDEWCLFDEKIDKESLKIMLETYNMAKSWLEEKGYMTFGRRGEREMDKLDPFHYRKECKRKGLAFEIIDIKDGNKVRCRKIYLDGHIEGFKGNPLVTNYILPKMQALRYFARQMNEEYRKLMREFILADFYPMEILDNMYKKHKETIDKI